MPPKKFEPKVVPRRLKKLSEIKSESPEDVSAVQKLIQEAQNAANSRRRGADNKAAPTRVAFGCGSATAARAATGFGRRISSSGGGSASGSGSAVAGRRDKKPSTSELAEELLLVDDKNHQTKQDLIDLDDSCPISLPLRRPKSVGSEYSDDEGDENVVMDDDDEAEIGGSGGAAKEVGLQESSLEERLIFLQLPNVLPVLEEQKSFGAKSPLPQFPQGHLGKLRVHKSGAIKLHIGDVMYNVNPGTRCVFSQEVVAINSSKRSCAFLGDVGQRLVVTPDVDNLLDTI